ncbi:MAG TPA: acetyl-CoA carboxylase carboxyl transferase subunit beta, partial [Bacilli bacterium]
MSVFKDLFHKKRKYATIPSEKTKREIPEGLMNKCKKCGNVQFSKELEKNLMVCTPCGYHFRLNAMERFEITLDDGRLFEYDKDMISMDPLEFPGY